MAITSFTSSLHHQVSDIINNKFCVIPWQLIKKSKHHIIYLSSLFSGDSSSAIILSTKGLLYGMHQETVNEKIRFSESDSSVDEDVNNNNNNNNEEVISHRPTKLQKVTDSVNSLVSSLATGFIGLRLDNEDIQQFILS